MKRFKSYILGLAAIATAVGFVGCQDDFDDHTPTLDIPTATLQPNTTILELKQTFWKDEVNYIDTVRTKTDGSHYIVSGRVISSDRAGNVYKKLVIQDATGALPISIDYNSLYQQYRVGQEIVIDVTGMYIGKYNGTEQLGYPTFYEKGQVWEATFMSYGMFEDHIQLNGLPDASLVDTITIRKFSDLPTVPTDLPAYQSQLVRFNNVHFADGGQKAVTDGYKINTNRILYDADGQSITVRTSGYANFREVMLPEGSGDIVAILDYYATSADADSPWRLTLIDREGMMNFGNPTMLPGSEDNPYQVSEVIDLEREGSTDRAWMTGYIVGAVAPEVTTISSNSDIEFGSEVVLGNTLVVAQSPDCTDWRECIVVPLVQDSPLQQTGNLRDNPANYKKQIWLFGSFKTYMGTWGLVDNSGATSQYRIDGVEIPGGEFPEGSGTEDSPYNVAQIIALNPTSTQEAVATGVWVRGYIVGSMPTGGSSTTLSGTNFSTADAATTNMVIAPTADCTDYNKCIGIQLPTSVRGELSLANNPGNLGREVALYGDVMKYCGGPGLKNTSKFVLGEGGGDQPDVPTPPAGGGTGEKDSPYSCSQVIALNPTSTQEAVATGVWAEGYIVGSMPTGGNSTTLSGTNFSTADAATTNMVIAPTADCTDYTMCIGIQLPSSMRGELALANKPDNLGKKVKLCGDVMKYCGGPGLKNVTAYELEGQSSGDTPTPSGDAIYTALSSTDADLTTGWRYDDISLGSDLSYVWTWKEYNSAHYLNASAFFNNAAIAAESYAVSPVISLAGAKGCAVTFEHAAKFQTTLLTDGSGLYVREKGQTAWTRLEIPVWPEAGSWTWVSSGSISLAAYDGKEIELAFRYVSTSAGADTWEIRNLKVTGSK